MTTFNTSEDWLKQSTLLLQARPTTARVTSKYTILSPTSSKITKKRAKARSNKPSSPPPDDATAQQPQGSFTLKTYDPVSGVCLKYRTDKAAEVGRLVAGLGSLGRVMAALPPKQDEEMVDADDAKDLDASLPAKGEEKSAPAPAQNSGAGGEGGGGKKKKKKGKK